MAYVLIPNVIFDDVELILFDKDGTLIDLYTYWSKIVALRAKLISIGLEHISGQSDLQKQLISVMGIDCHNKRIKPEGPVIVHPRSVVQEKTVEYLQSIGFDSWRVPNVVTIAFGEADALSKYDLDDFIQPIKGVDRVYESMRAHFVKCGIITTDLHNRAEVAALAIGWHPDVIIGVDDVERGKPYPDMILEACATVGVEPRSTIVVGDSTKDIQCGTNAGVKASIAVCTGLETAEELWKSTRYVVPTVADIRVEP